LQLLNKISFEEASIDVSLLPDIWGGVFFHPAFIGPASQSQHLRDGCIAIKSDKYPVAAGNFLYKSRPIFTVSTLPMLFQYYGIILLNSESGPVVFPAFEKYLSNHYDFVYLSFPPGIDIDSMPKGWTCIPQVTPVITGSDLKSWGARFRDDVKNKIRKARRERIEIAEGTEFPTELWRMTFKRKGLTTPIDPAALSNWCRSLTQSSILKLYLAKIDGQPIAFRGQLIWGGFAYDWIAGSDSEYHATGANQLLMATIGDELVKLNLTAWDLVGGQIGSIADFKKSFGAIELTHFHAYKSFNYKGRFFQVLRRFRHG